MVLFMPVFMRLYGVFYFFKIDRKVKKHGNEKNTDINHSVRTTVIYFI